MVGTINIFWFRRDLRLEDNAGLYHALSAGLPVLPIFIFDTEILNQLDEKNDRRVNFILHVINHLQEQLEKTGTTLDVRIGKPVSVFKKLLIDYKIENVFTNRDYEPYAIQRDKEVGLLLEQNSIGFKTFKDQVIFEKKEVVKDDGTPYSIYTPFSKKWKALLDKKMLQPFHSGKLKNFIQKKPIPIPTIRSLNFELSDYPTLFHLDEDVLRYYHKTRDIPAIDGTSRVGVHLRFGTVSIRYLVAKALELNETYLNELIWREFFMQMLWHYPRLVHESCKKEYENIEWRNDEEEFERWCQGQTGYPIVDAGMRELNETGFMHNRVRMITASFLVKHLLIDWRWGEAYFAKKLLDYELASNNGNWQWVAGCGCDAAPYFRIFNPYTQTKRFDSKLQYIQKWIPELNSFSYPQPMIDHEQARSRCLRVYKKALETKIK